eukprot:TRINITY_DN2804_c0_g1::TRINITY_DN2804_c0_g1_i4::g.6067::m.6067 TRINITY_DN2804_c0_g1::TRINITY_DN2804_c0_g1_i4::g.6067  ORF type:complete len:318 (-),score=15.92 TRINITY_DN2804_c0_g1_i4:8-925(-)
MGGFMKKSRVREEDVNHQVYVEKTLNTLLSPSDSESTWTFPLGDLLQEWSQQHLAGLSISKLHEKNHSIVIQLHEIVLTPFIPQEVVIGTTVKCGSRMLDVRTFSADEGGSRTFPEHMNCLLGSYDFLNMKFHDQFLLLDTKTRTKTSNVTDYTHAAKLPSQHPLSTFLSAWGTPAIPSELENKSWFTRHHATQVATNRSKQLAILYEPFNLLYVPDSNISHILMTSEVKQLIEPYVIQEMQDALEHCVLSRRDDVSQLHVVVKRQSPLPASLHNKPLGLTFRIGFKVHVVQEKESKDSTDQFRE